MKTVGTIGTFRRMVEDPSFSRGQLFLMRGREHGRLMRFRAEGVEYDFTDDFCSLRFEACRMGEDVRIFLREATGPLEFRQDYEGTPRGVFSWEWFEIALEGSALDAGQDVPDQNSREFVRLADFMSMVLSDEDYAKRRVSPRRAEVRPIPKSSAAPAFAGEAVETLQ